MSLGSVLKAMMIGLSVGLYAGCPPQGPLLLERGPMKPRVIVRPARLGMLPPAAR